MGFRMKKTKSRTLSGRPRTKLRRGCFHTPYPPPRSDATPRRKQSPRVLTPSCPLSGKSLNQQSASSA